MKHTIRLRWLAAGFAVVLAAGATSDLWGQEAPLVTSNDSSSNAALYIQWGDPQFTSEAGYWGNGPAWWVPPAFAAGGQFQTNDPTCWHVAAECGGEPCLGIWFDRDTIPGDLAMSLLFFDYANSTLFVDLTDTNDEAVATNLFGNLASGSENPVEVDRQIPLSLFNSAVGVRIRRGTGEATVYASSFRPMDAAVDSTSATQESPPVQGSAIPAGSTTAGTPAEGTQSTDNGASSGGANGVTDGNAGSSGGGTTSNKTIYVDGQTGDDLNNGLSASVQGSLNGPKRTINAGLAATQPGDIVMVAGGTYRENVDLSGLNIEFLLTGDVVLTDNGETEGGAM